MSGPAAAHSSTSSADRSRTTAGSGRQGRKCTSRCPIATTAPRSLRRISDATAVSTPRTHRATKRMPMKFVLPHRGPGRRHAVPHRRRGKPHCADGYLSAGGRTSWPTGYPAAALAATRFPAADRARSRDLTGSTPRHWYEFRAAPSSSLGRAGYIGEEAAADHRGCGSIRRSARLRYCPVRDYPERDGKGVGCSGGTGTRAAASVMDRRCHCRTAGRVRPARGRGRIHCC